MKKAQPLGKTAKTDKNHVCEKLKSHDCKQANAATWAQKA
jgi:hypothetical protein